jgi:hypothetical protein
MVFLPSTHLKRQLTPVLDNLLTISSLHRLVLANAASTQTDGSRSATNHPSIAHFMSVKWARYTSHKHHAHFKTKRKACISKASKTKSTITHLTRPLSPSPSATVVANYMFLSLVPGSGLLDGDPSITQTTSHPLHPSSLPAKL